MVSVFSNDYRYLKRFLNPGLQTQMFAPAKTENLSGMIGSQEELTALDTGNVLRPILYMKAFHRIRKRYF
jgi:hypothetical protein